MTDRPAPLTPAGCSLQDFPHTPIFRSRLFGSSFHARTTDGEWRAGVTLWLKSWDQVPAGSLPDDDIELCRLAELRSVRAWRKVKTNAMRGWQLCADGRLYHPVVSIGVSRAWDAKQKRQRRIIRRLEIESEQWAQLRLAVFTRDSFICCYCGGHGVRLEADHVVPVSKGGPSTLENLVTACKPCNRKKGVKSLEEWRAAA